ncbi:MAG: hypothetical protein R3F62_05550 [Planctomycetota bacterium]
MALGAAACTSLPRGDGRVAVQRHAKNVAPLLAVEGPPALGVAVRVTPRRVYFAVAPTTHHPSRTLTHGELALPAKPVGSAGAPLLAVERPERVDYRPCLVGRPRGAEPLVALSGGGGAVSAWATRAPEDMPPVGPYAVVAPRWLPLTSEGAELEPEPGPELVGAPVFSEGGAWVGFLELRDETWVVAPPRQDELLTHALESGGADVLLPSDPGELLSLRVTTVSAVPDVEDEWGEPDFFLRVRVRGRPLDPIPLDAQEHHLRLPLDAHELEVELVERDVSLTEGDHSVRVAGPAELLPVGLAQRLLLPRGDAEAVEFTCESRYLDPERASSEDRTPLGARPLPIRRVISDSVSQARGDSTDLWRFEAEPAQYVAAVLRRGSDATLDVSIHGPSLQRTYLRGRLVEGRHLRILPTVAPLAPGPVLLRVSQLGGEQPTEYALVVARRDDPLSLVRTLFRLVARESARQPYLDTQEFAREAFEALALDAKLDRAELTRAILAELGHRSRAGRHLALRLLEHNFRPEEEALRSIYVGAGGIRSLDAGLLLALRHPNDSGYAQVIELAARDPDPLVRLLGLAVASAFTTPDRREALRQLFADDPSPRIQRVWARTR